MMKIWFISDSHCQHHKLKVPECNMVCHCGDFSNSRNPNQSFLEVLDFLNWYGELPIKYKVLTCGNHDIFCEKHTAEFKDLCKTRGIIPLIHDVTTIEGITIVGSPYTPTYGNWAFMKKRGEKIDRMWRQLPPCDILLTHGPSQGILDLADDIDDRKRIVQVGCKNLLNNLSRINPKIHVCGHIHSTDRFNNYGKFELDRVYINCAVYGPTLFNGILHTLGG